MFRLNKLVLLTLAVVFALATVGTALATEVGGGQEKTGKISKFRQDFRDNMRALIGPPADPSTIPNLDGGAVAPSRAANFMPVYSPAAPCVTLTNMCPGLEDVYIFSVPSAAGTGSRRALATQFTNAGTKPESVVTVHVTVLWDPNGEIIAGLPNAGTPALRVHLQGDLAGLPDDGNILATVVRPFVDWSADPALVLVAPTAIEGVLAFDVSGAGVVLPPGGKVHATVWVDQTTPGVDWLWLEADNGPSSTCLSKSSNYRSTIPGWRGTLADYGAPFNFSIYATLCTEQPPPVCFTQHNWCLAGDAVTIFGMPRTNRNAFATRYFAGQAGQAQACTVKAIYPWFYENNPADSADVVVMIFEDNGAGLPGAVVWSDSLPYASLVKNLSGPTTVPVPDVVVTGEYYIGYRAVNSSVGLSTAITFVGSSLAGTSTDCPQASYNPNAMFVLLADNVTWVDDVGFFGANSELWVDADICCPALEFIACTPGSESDWETQGNGVGRPNASPAAISSLCGLVQTWSHDFALASHAIQPIIAGDKVIVASTDSIHAIDKATGAEVWKVGGFPYIVGALRGSATVDLGAGRVYFGGGTAQSFTCVDLATGAVIWSRNLGGADPPFLPLSPGATLWTPSILMGGVIYFTQQTNNLYALDAATGLDVVGPMVVPGGPSAIPLNGLTSNGVDKLWVGTANSVGTAGRLVQVNAATLTVDWSLINPGMTFYPGNADFYNPEGFPGSLAYEDGILYYHSQIRNDANGFLHFPQTGAVGAIDVALEDGTGAGILWVNDASDKTLASPGTVVAGTFDYSGPAIGPGMLYLTSRGFFGGTTEQDGTSAWDKTLGVRVWYKGYTNLGTLGGVSVLDDARNDAPATVICVANGTPYVFAGTVGGKWRLFNGNDGKLEWERNFRGRVRGTAVADDFAVTIVSGGGLLGGGSLVAFTPGADRPRLQIDSMFVFRTATPGDGATSDDVVDAIRNTGCATLTINAYTDVPATALRVSSVHPGLASSSRRATSSLAGYNSFLDAPTAKQLSIQRLALEGDEEESLVRTFANNARSAADPDFLTVNTAPGPIAAGATQSINITYDETGLTNNTGYINYIDIDSDDPDYYPQDPSGAAFGDPFITVNLFIGCPDASDYIVGGNGEEWITNFGGIADGHGEGFHVNAKDYHFDGGFAMVVQDSVHWALEGCSVGDYPRRAGEWGPTLPCGITIQDNNYPGPAGADAVKEVEYNMIDLASTNGKFPASTRQCGGLVLNMQRIISTTTLWSDFAVGRVTITNEPGNFGDLTGTLNNIIFGVLVDWDVTPYAQNNNTIYPNGSYACDNGGAAGRGNATAYAGHVRLDANAYGAGSLGSGGSPNFMMGDMFNDQGRGNRAFDMLNNPSTYHTVVPGAVVQNTDVGTVMSFIKIPSLADGASATAYFAVYQVDKGLNGLSWSDAASFDRSVSEIQCRAKAFAGFGKGDLNCDGGLDLADVVMLGNILDGAPATGAAIYTADTNGDNAYTQADYDLLYDVVAGLQPASALANVWRF